MAVEQGQLPTLVCNGICGDLTALPFRNHTLPWSNRSTCCLTSAYVLVPQSEGSLRQPSLKPSAMRWSPKQFDKSLGRSVAFFGAQVRAAQTLVAHRVTSVHSGHHEVGEIASSQRRSTLGHSRGSCCVLSLFEVALADVKQAGLWRGVRGWSSSTIVEAPSTGACHKFRLSHVHPLTLPLLHWHSSRSTKVQHVGLRFTTPRCKRNLRGRPGPRSALGGTRHSISGQSVANKPSGRVSAPSGAQRPAGNAAPRLRS